MSTTVTECPFKSAKELGLEQREWEALIKTLLLMEADAIVHVPRPSLVIGKIEGSLFNMSSWNDEFGCGTVCCIGGSAEVFGGLDRSTMSMAADRLGCDEEDPNLHNLFFNWVGDPTPRQAAAVLRGYLTTGYTDWHKVMWEK